MVSGQFCPRFGQRGRLCGSKSGFGGSLRQEEWIGYDLSYVFASSGCTDYLNKGIIISLGGFIFLPRLGYIGCF